MTIPMLNVGASPSFPALVESTANPVGISVADLVVDGSITDPDDAVEAIALEAVNASLGTWQYSIAGGNTWVAVYANLLNSTTNSLALLLDDVDKVRLLRFGALKGHWLMPSRFGENILRLMKAKNIAGKTALGRSR